jgi:hypothetical protein
MSILKHKWWDNQNISYMEALDSKISRKKGFESKRSERCKHLVVD